MNLFHPQRRYFGTRICFSLILFFLLIDTFSGYVLHTFHFSISLPFKVFLAFLLFLINIKHHAYLSILAISTIPFYLLLQCAYYKNLSAISLNISWLLKFAIIVLTYDFFTTMIRKRIFEAEQIINVAKVSFWILGLNLIIGLFGIGFSQYDGNIGNKGFIYAGNEMTVALIVSGAIVLIDGLLNKKYRSYVVYSILLIAFSVIKVTKTAILSSFLIVCLLPLLEISLRRVETKKLKFIGFISLFALIAIPIAVYMALYKVGLMSRLSYWYERLDFITLLFSNRNVWAADAWRYFINDYSIYEMLIGKTVSIFTVAVGKSVEIDAVDFLLAFGLIGTFIGYGFFFYVMILSGSRSFQGEYVYSRYCFILFVLLVITSLISGHVIMSGIAGPLIGLSASLINIRKPQY